MKKFISILSIFLMTSAAHSQQVSFKLTGGLAWLTGGDYNRGVLGENSYLKATTQNMTGAYEELKSGMNYHFEIINYFGPSLGVGFGIDYSRASNDSGVVFKRMPADGSYDNTSSYKPTLSAISFSLNAHYLKTLSPRLNLDVFAGPVFYVCQYDFENHMTSSESSLDQTVSFTASSIALGLQGGLGLNYKMSRCLTLIVDLTCRYGEVAEQSGNWAVNGNSTSGTISTSSDSYFLWAFDDTAGGGKNFRIGLYDKNGPQGGTVSGVKKAVLNLSGVSIMAGFKLNI